MAGELRGSWNSAPGTSLPPHCALLLGKMAKLSMMHLTKASQPPTDRRRRSVASVRKRRNRVVARVLTILLAVPLGLLTAAPSLVQPTEAAWQRTHMTAAKASAMTVPAATLRDRCRIGSLLGLGTGVLISWSPPPGYDLTKAQIHSGPPQAGATLARLPGSVVNNTNTTFDAATNRYTTVVSLGLLDGVLSPGREVQLGIVMSDYTWTSAPASVIYVPGTLLGIGASCRNLT